MVQRGTCRRRDKWKMGEIGLIQPAAGVVPGGPPCDALPLVIGSDHLHPTPIPPAGCSPLHLAPSTIPHSPSPEIVPGQDISSNMMMQASAWDGSASW